jgi:hypothetical protein
MDLPEVEEGNVEKEMPEKGNICREGRLEEKCL